MGHACIVFEIDALFYPDGAINTNCKTNLFFSIARLTNAESILLLK
jgi:hypothetical protein